MKTPASFFTASIRVTWTRAGTSPIDGYRVFKSFGTPDDFQQVAQITRNSYVDSDFNPGFRSYYKVRPFTDSAGNEASLGTTFAVHRSAADGTHPLLLDRWHDFRRRG